MENRNLVTAITSRLKVVAQNFSRAISKSRKLAEAPYVHASSEQCMHPYRAEAQPPCKYDGTEISYRCDPW